MHRVDLGESFPTSIYYSKKSEIKLLLDCGGMPLSYSEPKPPLEWCARMEGTGVDLSPPEEDDTKEKKRKERKRPKWL